MWRCHYCLSELSLEILRKHRLCPQCGSDLHCCKNCVYYDEFKSSKCREPNSPWIRDRAAQNHCTFFEFRKILDSAAPNPTSDTTTEAERAKEAFRALFRDA